LGMPLATLCVAGRRASQNEFPTKRLGTRKIVPKFHLGTQCSRSSASNLNQAELSNQCIPK